MAVIGFSIAVIGLALALVFAMGALRDERERSTTLAATLDSLRTAASRPAPVAATLSARERALRDDLVKHPELIPYPAVMGGTMFFVPQRIVILDDRWAFAEFEDGHVAGSMLLEYDVRDGRILWKRLAARRD